MKVVYQYLIATLHILFIQVSNALLNCEIEGETARYIHYTSDGYETIDDPLSLAANIKTYIIVHGWNSNIEDDPQLQTMADTLLSVGDCNIIMVDYEEYANRPYICAQTIVKQVGDDLADFLIDAIRYNFIQANNTHFIGQSLGAHVAGYAARSVQDATGYQIRRISALDPAGPLFQFSIINENHVLRSTDARVVDVLHCTIIFGKIGAIGTVDFYAKGLFGLRYAILQRPCVLRPLQIGCSHQMCKEYYTESITSCAIRGKRRHGTDIAIYGHHMDESTTGIFKFTPKFTSPYGSYDSYCDEAIVMKYGFDTSRVERILDYKQLYHLLIFISLQLIICSKYLYY